MQKSRPTQNKRMRERARQEKQKEKAARRLEAKNRKPVVPDVAPGEDPDIAGIVPGPQPSPWGDDDLDDFGASDDAGEGDEASGEAPEAPKEASKNE